MHVVERVSFEPLAKLLKQAAPAKASELDEFLSQLQPVCQIDRTEERLLFRACSASKTIEFGMKCTCRLQSHAYAAAAIILALGECENRVATDDERHALFHPADCFLNWAVSRDIQQSLLQTDGNELPLESIMTGAVNELPDGLLASLSQDQRRFGEGLFKLAAAFILLHEIGHIALAHTGSTGLWSIEQEREADRFAAAWLVEAASSERGSEEHSRLTVLFGISIALLWLTVRNVYLDCDESSTHPQPFERLYQVLNQYVDPANELEYGAVWHFISTMLYIHMENAGYEFRLEDFRVDPREEVNHLINRLSRGETGNVAD
jgi:hypothetical protein